MNNRPIQEIVREINEILPNFSYYISETGFEEYIKPTTDKLRPLLKELLNLIKNS